MRPQKETPGRDQDLGPMNAMDPMDALDDFQRLVSRSAANPVP